MATDSVEKYEQEICMTPLEYQQHIQALQQLRHRLLRRREEPGAATIAIDMELNIVRTELHALYAQLRILAHRER